MKKYYLSTGIFIVFCFVTLAIIDDHRLLFALVIAGLIILFLCFKIFWLRDELNRKNHELYVSEKTVSELMEGLTKDSLCDIGRTAEKYLEKETNPLFREKLKIFKKMAGIQWFCKNYR